MSNAAQFFGGRGAPHPTGLLNGASAFKQVDNINVNSLGVGFTPVKVVLCGATTAGVLKTILSLSGSGVLSFLGLESYDTTARAHRLKVTLDGVVIFDATTGSVTQVIYSFMAIGAMTNLVTSASSVVTFEPLAFNTSLLIEYADSLSETDGAYIGYRYYPT